MRRPRFPNGNDYTVGARLQCMAMRRIGGFRPVGSLQRPIEGLSPRRLRLLELRRVWAAAAGDALAAHVQPSRVERGTLWLGADDREWAKATEGLLEQIAGRLRALSPQLQLARFTILVAGEIVSRGRLKPVQASPGGSPQDASHAQAPQGDESAPHAPGRPRRPPKVAATSAEQRLERLQAIRDRYVARAEARGDDDSD